MTANDLGVTVDTFAKQLCEQHPELRSVAVIFDYHGDGNDIPEHPAGVWLTAAGGVQLGDWETMSGMLNQTAKLLDHQMRSIIECMGFFQKETASYCRTLQALESEIHEAKNATRPEEQGASQ